MARALQIGQASPTFTGTYKVGEVFSVGMFNGAIVTGTYRVVAVEGFQALCEPVRSREIKNIDGTFSTVYEAI